MDKEARIDFLGNVFKCKIGLDRGVDVDAKIDSTLSVMKYPFNVYLKYLSEKSKGSKEGAVKWANELLTFDNEISYNKLYADLFVQASKEIDPEYNFESLPVMDISEDNILLTGCYLDQPRPFDVRVSNTGKTDLAIKTIDVGCSCITQVSQEIPVIEPGGSFDIKFVFTPDKEGDITRELTILSNAQNKIETIHIKALSVE